MVAWEAMSLAAELRGRADEAGREADRLEMAGSPRSLILEADESLFARAAIALEMLAKVGRKAAKGEL
jgi:hypothetical protein